VADWYGENYYSQSPAGTPTGPAGWKWRLVRGGAWNELDTGMLSAFRQMIHP
jgi:hypothetical protein